MSETSLEEPVKAAADALTIAEESLQVARASELEKSAAEDRAKKAEDKLVELQKVASVHDETISKFTDFLKQAGYLAEENCEKFASSLFEDPDLLTNTFKRLIDFSAESYDEGSEIPKAASEVELDPAAAALAQERALWEKVATEGA